MNHPDKIKHYFRENEEDAFKLFFEESYGILVLFAVSILNDTEAAEDVVQECFVDFWVNRRFSDISGSLNTYMHQAVKHKAFNYIRNRKRRDLRHTQLVTDTQQAETGEATRQGELDLLYAAIDRLPEERKRIFNMVYIEGLKYQETAERLGISVNTVKTQLGRAFKKIRNELHPDDFSILFLFGRKGYSRHL